MPKSVGRVGKDKAGGLLTGPLVPTVTVDGLPIAVVGTPIAGHGKFPHSSATMKTGSPNVYAGGLPVCGAKDVASCGDPLISTSRVIVN